MKKIIVLSKQSLFGDGLISLLSKETDLELIKLDQKLDDVVSMIQVKNPDAMIINCDDPPQDISQAILFTLKEKYNLKIIGLSIANNQVTVFRGEQKKILHITDLMNVIHADE